MTQPPPKSSIPLPVLTTIKAAYGDVFGKLSAFLNVIWLILLMMVLFVEIPTLIVTQEIFSTLHPDAASAKPLEAKIDLPDTEKNALEKKQPPAETDPSTPASIPRDESTQSITMEEAQRVRPEHVLMIMALNLLQMAMIFSFSVAWYRQLLMDDRKGKTILFNYGKPEWNFTLTSMKSGFVLAPVVLVIVSYIMASIPGFSGPEAIPLQESWPVFLGGGILMLYLLARLSMGYPLTIMGHIAEPIRQSWLMTKYQAGRILIGSLIMALPVLLVSLLIVVGISILITSTGNVFSGENVPASTQISFAEHVIFKTVGSAFILFLFALVSAFYARVYAFLVRSQQG